MIDVNGHVGLSSSNEIMIHMMTATLDLRNYKTTLRHSPCIVAGID